MKTVTFADIVFKPITFFTDTPYQPLLLSLIDSRWFQRLRDISQTANTRLVYMYSEHSRFGHCIGVCYLAEVTIQMLLRSGALPHKQRAEVEQYRDAVVIASLLHDLGHLAPGSHIAFRTWFPDYPDTHEELAGRILREDSELHQLITSYRPQLLEDVCKILVASPDIPAWTWELLSSGGWNCDRGHWCIADSLLAGVRYGDYNINAITESLTISEDSHLALRENRLDAMMHFSVSRHAMYRQIFQHRVLLSADTLNSSLVARARSLPQEAFWCDDVMREALQASHPGHLRLDVIFGMREAWWRYHLFQWERSTDDILSDLASRLLNRRLLKTIKLHEKNADSLITQAKAICSTQGYDPNYYCHTVSTVNTQSDETKHSVQVLTEQGACCSLADLDPLFRALTETAKSSWLVVPAEVKSQLLSSR